MVLSSVLHRQHARMLSRRHHAVAVLLSHLTWHLPLCVALHFGTGGCRAVHHITALKVDGALVATQIRSRLIFLHLQVLILGCEVV